MASRERIPGPRDHCDSPASAFSLREAEQRVRILQLLQVRSLELLRRKVDLDLLDRPPESKRSLVGVAHRRPGVLARVERLVGREPAEDRLRDPALRHLRAVHEQGAGAALADAAAVVLEREADGVLAGRQLVLAGYPVALDGEIVVLVGELAILDEEGVATDG